MKKTKAPDPMALMAERESWTLPPWRVPAWTRAALFATQVDIAATRAALADNSDPFAFKRAVNDMRSGRVHPRDMLDAANRLLATRGYYSLRRRKKAGGR